MKVIAQFQGILADWVGARSASFNLQASAVLTDLMEEIRVRYAENMPEGLWDHERNAFKRQVVPISNGEILRSLDIPLEDGEEIRFFIMAGGG
jgi:molybdopterin converting factor small subunit